MREREELICVLIYLHSDSVVTFLCGYSESGCFKIQYRTRAGRNLFFPGHCTSHRIILLVHRLVSSPRHTT